MKRIIYTQRVEIIESYNERRDCADQMIAKLIFECGYLPIPVNNNPREVLDFLSEINPDGIIFTGGNDLIKYGGNAPERDEVERKLLDFGIKQSIPMYGFCRGMQMIADYFGCGLVRVNDHAGTRHSLVGDRLFDSRNVNSYHNFAVRDVRDPLIISAKSKDGVIEAITHKNAQILATMWHPERENPYNEDDLRLIRQFFK